MRAAAPVVERLRGRRPAVGYLDVDGFVVVVTRAGPLLPNGASLAGDGVWDPTLRLARDPAALGGWILDALGATGAAVPDDPAGLIGRGPGLTPEGDDFVAGLAAVTAAGGRHAYARGMIGPDLRRRTTVLSATLLELAAAGMGPEPLQALVAGERAALDRLLRVGHSSGRAYAIGAAVGLLTVV